MAGVFDLKTPSDLFQKLGRELGRMRATSDKRGDWGDHVDAAFNFFVTAEHMLDWTRPGRKARNERETMREANALTRITWDLASGAKHLELDDKHKAGRGSGVMHSVPPVPKFWFMDRPALVVTLTNRDMEELGLTQGWIKALELADRVHQYWGSRLSPLT